MPYVILRAQKRHIWDSKALKKTYIRFLSAQNIIFAILKR